MFVVLFLPLGAVVAAACFYYAYHWLKTPFLWNVAGGAFAFLAVFCLGGAYIPRTGPWAYNEGLASSSYTAPMQFVGLAVLSYVFGYIVRTLAQKAGYVEDAEDKV